VATGTIISPAISATPKRTLRILIFEDVCLSIPYGERRTILNGAT